MRRLIFALALAFTLSLLAVPLAAETFPFANFGDAMSGRYSTALVLTNPGTEPVPVPAINHAFAVQPGEARVLDGFPGAGGATFDLDVPAGLDAAVEISVVLSHRRPAILPELAEERAPLLMRVSDIGGPVDYARWLGVRSDTDWATYLFVDARESTTLQIMAWNDDGVMVGHRDLLLHAGDVVIPEAPLGARYVSLGYYHGIGEENVPLAPFHVFAFMTHRSTGNMIPLKRY